MRLIAPMIAAACVAFLALPAAASPAFDAFRQACGDNHTDFAAIKTALAGSAWTPADVQPTNMENVTLTESIARTASVGGARVTVFAWEGTKGAFHVTACTARVAKGALGELTHESQAWLGFAPASVDGGKSTWRYGETGGKPAAAEQAGYQAAAGGGGLFFYNVFADHGDIVLDLLKIKS